MKKLKMEVEKMERIKILFLMFVLLISGFAFADGNNSQSQEFTAQQILKNVDEIINAPKDQEITVEMILIDKKGDEKVRKVKIWQKGSDKRMVKFLSPADVKGLAFLNLPNDMMYLYLPAFRKIRRIASHVKNTNFAGTDFTYDDIASTNYSEIYDAKLLKSNDQSKEQLYELELAPKEGIKKEYSKLIMAVRKDNFYPVKIEFYSKEGKLVKVMENSKIEKEGKYWIAKQALMHDLDKEHKTKMIILEIKFDQNLGDELFSKRYLKRR
jgi:outer membrane lipoprotein-sorting protein